MNSDQQRHAQTLGLAPERLPKHVAVIMDGNGRWAKKRLLQRVNGHEKGADSVRRVVRACREIGIPVLTLYAFSTENWQRPKAEISALMNLLKHFLEKETAEMVANDIRLSVIGQIDRLPVDVRFALEQTMAKTRHNQRLRLNLALSYGGRAELVDMVRHIAADIAQGRIDATQVDEALVARYLYTRDLPDPDLLIRTSGEMRISNFLLWQIAYAEIHVTPTLWPDFSKEEFVSILAAYQARERRFGRV